MISAAIGAVIGIVVLPWLFLRLENIPVRVVLTAVWMIIIIGITLLYLGFFSYHYMGPQMGFSTQGNPLNWVLIIVGILSAAPFAFTAFKGKLKRPIRSTILVGVALFILIGPAIYNSVAFAIYTQGGGEWKCGDDPDYGCEVDIPTKPDDWSMAQDVGLVFCNLLPACIAIGIWQLARTAKSDVEASVSAGKLSLEE
jgi:hypothetical protein